MKKRSNTLRCLILLCMCIAGFGYIFLHNETSANVQEGIAKEVIRFHVIANSDREVDQKVKLIVKDRVVRYMQGKLANTKSRNEAKQVMKREMPQIKRIAQKTVRNKGYHYSCDVIYHQREFPIKIYGDLTFPAGKYEALDVILGKAEGKNWWCVMFPSLCFVDGTYSYVPDNSKNKLRQVLTEEEYRTIAKKKKSNVEYKLKISEWGKSAKKQLMKIVE